MIGGRYEVDSGSWVEYTGDRRADDGISQKIRREISLLEFSSDVAFRQLSVQRTNISNTAAL